MKMVRCPHCHKVNCIYLVSDGKCLFCDNSINDLPPSSPLFDTPYLFLNKKIVDIDDLVFSNKQTNKLRALFDDVLEWQPQISTVHWRRFLASVGCRNSYDVIYKGVLIEGNAAYEAAYRHGSDEECEAYSLLVNTRARVVRLLETELNKSEKNKKVGTDAEKKLAELKAQLVVQEKQAEEHIETLENIERSIREQEMDCSYIAGEYKYTLKSVSQQVSDIGNRIKNEISYDEKANLEIQLSALQHVSNVDYEQLVPLSSSHPAFLEYSRLVSEQETLHSKIVEKKSELELTKRNIEQLLEEIKQIIEEYDDARKGILMGDYSESENLLSTARFKAIIKQALREVK